MKKIIVTFAILSIGLVYMMFQHGNLNNKFGNQVNLSPKEVVELYIDSAIKGEEEKISSIITNAPDSYFEECKKSNIKNNSYLNKEKFVFNKEHIDTDEDIKFKKRNLSDKFADMSSIEDKNSLAYFEARYVYATHSIFNEIKIYNTNVHGDEASVEVKYIVSKSSYNRSKFLLRRDNQWKIFKTASLDDLNLIQNKNFAKPRPECGKNM